MSAAAPVLASTVDRQFVTLIVNAFGIVAALAWSDALTGLFKPMFAEHPLAGPFAYAACLTLLAFAVGKALASQVQETCTRLCDDSMRVRPTGAPRGTT